MYADDLVLLSETSEGLQECLNRLNDYCNTWGLEVNVNKTKTVVFNKTGRLTPVALSVGNKMLKHIHTLV